MGAHRDWPDRHAITNTPDAAYFHHHSAQHSDAHRHHDEYKDRNVDAFVDTDIGREPDHHSHCNVDADIYRCTLGSQWTEG